MTSTPADHASGAAEAIRALNHATLSPSQNGWEYPSDAYDVIGGLDRASGYLPQALDQIARHIERLSTLGHIRSDNGGNGTTEVDTALRALESARANATALASQLTTVHAALAPLAWQE